MHLKLILKLNPITMNKVISILSINLFFLICTVTVNGQEDRKSEKEHPTKQATVEMPELNNGEKWQVNEEMKPHIKNAESAFHEFLSKPAPNYKELSEVLNEQNQNLIASCTMKGKSHDELHKWLYPHLQLVKGLSNAKSDNEANKILGDIRMSFITYHKYFE